MRIDHLIRTLTAHAWAMEPHTLRLGASILQRKVAGESFTGPMLHAELNVPYTPQNGHPDRPRDGGLEPVRPAAGRGASGGDAMVAIVPINGVIESRPMSLGTSPRMISGEFNAAVASRQVDAIVLDIASPGGQSTGILELADTIFEARKTKPVIAFTDDMAASAAYWLGAAAREFWMTESADGAGSIGVFMMHLDESGWLENEGLKLEVISAGKFKLEGAPWAPLSEEAREFYGAEVDKIYGWFVKDAARFRGATQTAVRAGFGEGRVLAGQAVVKANLVDRIGSLDQAIARAAELAGRKAKSATGGRRTAALRRRLALES